MHTGRRDIMERACLYIVGIVKEHFIKVDVIDFFYKSFQQQHMWLDPSTSGDHGVS